MLYIHVYIHTNQLGCEEWRVCIMGTIGYLLHFSSLISSPLGHSAVCPFVKAGTHSLDIDTALVLPTDLPRSTFHVR